MPATSPDTLPFVLHWDADALTDAMLRLRPPPLRSVVFAPSANDAEHHRPRRTGSFIPAQPVLPHFRIGG